MLHTPGTVTKHSLPPLIAALAATAMLTAAVPVLPAAHAEPPPADQAASASDGTVASSPPATTTFADGVTLSLSATRETRVPIPALSPDQTSRDIVVGGIFTGSIGNVGSAAGTLEVGYQVGCDGPSGMLFGMINQLKPGETSVAVTKMDFTGTTPKADIAGYRLHIDRCPGPAFVRSYAILTRTGAQTISEVHYYGIPAIVPVVGVPG